MILLLHLVLNCALGIIGAFCGDMAFCYYTDIQPNALWIDWMVGIVVGAGLTVIGYKLGIF